jgi:ubiquinone/menaquinone biosynthesis C-methylase UbiE
MKNKTNMTWHETIQYIRSNPDYKDLVINAYFEEDLPLNVKRFYKSAEFIETLRLIRMYVPQISSILDIGSGNGISAISFALKNKNANIVAVEPDSSDTIGAGAIRKLKEYYHLDNIEIKEAFAEDLNFEKEQIDVVYARQSMHHANDLNSFVKESVKGLRKGGLFISIRDHVLYNHQEDKEWFLTSHPLHKFYGGENAFTEKEYIDAIKNSGLVIKKNLHHYDSVINCFPMSPQKMLLLKMVLFLKRIPLIKHINKIKKIGVEKNIPGRLISFIAVKI